MAATGLTTAYFSSGSGAPGAAPSVASGEYALYQDTATGNLYEWNLSGTPAWTAIGGGPRGKLGYVAQTTPQSTTSTTAVDIPSLTLTVTATARSLKITAYCPYFRHSADGSNCTMEIYDTTGAVVVADGTVTSAGANAGSIANVVAVVTPGAGSRSYKARFFVGSAGTCNFTVSATEPGFLLIEEI